MNEIFRMKEEGLVAILRGQHRKNVLQIIERLLEGGIRYVEVTADTTGAPDIIESAVTEFGADICVGAGTVLDAETANVVIQKGAKFVISPTLCVDTINLTKRHGVLSIPGAMTPTEMLLAYEKGADLVKLFPANTLEPNYIKSIQGPLPHVPIMATGGIDLNNMEEYFRAGATAVGIGNSLVESNLEITNENMSSITFRAKSFVEKFKEIKK